MKLKYTQCLLLFLMVASVFGSYAESSDGVEATPAKRYVLDKVIAVVGGTSILKSDVEKGALGVEERYKKAGYTSERSYEDEALEDLLMQKLLYSQALLDSLDISAGGVEMRVEEYINNMVSSAGSIKELEKIHNMEIFNIRETIRRTFEEQDYAQAMRGDIVSAVTIVPGEVEQYYNSLSRDSLPIIGEQIRYAHITRLPDNIDEAKRRVKERMLEMREKVISGEARFESLARMYSTDPGSAYRGGEMEPQPSSAFVPEFASALEALQPGQVSEVVETEFGFHIINLIDKKGNLYHCRHILLKPQYTTEEYMKPINMLDSLANVIRQDSVSFADAAYEYSDDAASKMNGGIVSNHDMLERYNAGAKMTVTKFLKEDFGAMGYKSLDDYNQLMKLKVGEVSNAFTTQDMLGNPISKIVKLVEIYPAHTATMEDDYLRLEGMALEDKQMKVFKEKLAKYIASTYIYIDPEYRGAKFDVEGWVK